jgi:signal transduction histidine kinase
MSAVAVADLAVGLAFLILAAVAWRRSRGLAVLAAAVALSWWLGSVWSEAVMWHRGPLIHLLIAYPRVWPDRTWVRLVILGGYAASLSPGTWASAPVAVALAAVLLAATVGRTVGAGAGVSGRRQAFEVLPALVVATAIVGDAVARAVVPYGAAVRPSFLAFCAALVAAAVLMAVGLQRSDAARVTDVVVELGEGGQAGLKAELALLLGDPRLELGVERDGAFVDESGEVLEHPGPGDSRRAVRVARHGAPDLLVLHNATPWDDPVLHAAVTRWAELSQANAELRRQAEVALEDVAASRRRLLVAADAERERLAHRIEASVNDPLRSLHDLLAARPEIAPLVRTRLRGLLDRLGAASHDLAPPALGRGLGAALEHLARESPLMVTVEERWPEDRGPRDPEVDPEVERAAYYVCAEALANAVKHADATRVKVSVLRDREELSVEISDDGRGGALPGASPGTGSGLAGLDDRVAALGGSLSVESTPGSGTTVRATLPLSGSRAAPGLLVEPHPVTRGGQADGGRLEGSGMLGGDASDGA